MSLVLLVLEIKHALTFIICITCFVDFLKNRKRRCQHFRRVLPALGSKYGRGWPRQRGLPGMPVPQLDVSRGRRLLRQHTLRRKRYRLSFFFHRALFARIFRASDHGARFDVRRTERVSVLSVFGRKFLHLVMSVRAFWIAVDITHIHTRRKYLRPIRHISRATAKGFTSDTTHCRLFDSGLSRLMFFLFNTKLKLNH